MGKLLTYASGLGATTVTWIAESIRDEHRQALEWLNQRTDPETHFFAVAVEVLQIDDSNPAQSFRVVVSPNDWGKRGSSSRARTTSPLTLSVYPDEPLWLHFFLNSSAAFRRIETLECGGLDVAYPPSTVTTDPGILIEHGMSWPEFARGDCNGIGGVDVADGIYLLNYLFNDAPGPNCPVACDVDDTGTLNLADVVALFSALFEGGTLLGGGQCQLHFIHGPLGCSTYSCP